MKPDRDPAPIRGRPRASDRPRTDGPGSDDPLLPERSRDESDIGWGEHPEPDDDERLRQDRPPHWDSR